MIVGGERPTVYLDDIELDLLKEACLDPEDAEISVYDEIDRILKAIEIALEPLQGAFSELAKSFECYDWAFDNVRDFWSEIEDAAEGVFAKDPLPRPPRFWCPFRTTAHRVPRHLLRKLYGQGVDAGGNL